MNWRNVVKMMLDGEPCKELMNFLENIEGILKSVDGIIGSRQLLAFAIATWEQMNPGKRSRK